MNLDYYAQHGAALFPLPAGSKIPGPKEFWEVDGRAGSFKHHYSTDPAQWERWQVEHPGCNFGLVAFASGLIVADIDTSGDQNEAWQAWTDLCVSWGLSEPLAPYCQSASGGWHVLFKIPPHIDPATLRQPDAIKGRINIRVIGYVVTAGSTFNGNLYQLFPDAPAPHPAPAALLEHCAPSAPREANNKVGTHDFEDAKKLYKWMAENGAIQSDEEWRNAGMAARLEFGDAGLELWESLATRSGGLDSLSMTRWHSFGTEATANAVTMDSIFKLAHNNGWKGSVRPSTESMFGGVAQLASAPSIAPIGYDMAAAPKRKHLRKLGDCVRGFIPPDYLVDGILQRRFCYSLTAQTGVGKTTVAMLLSAHVALGKQLGGIDVERGTVLYFAGENPTDVTMRWMGLCKEMGLDPDTVDVQIIEGVKRFSEEALEITQEIVDAGLNLALVVVDTAAAYFEGDNDNDNVQAGNHARMLRSLTTLPGGPAVLVLAHPTKGAKTIDEMTPRGGGAFLNEVDGNVGLARNESGVIVASALGKFRGPEFPALHFGLKVIKDHPLLVDTKGRQVPTIVAEAITTGEVQRRADKADKDSDKILKILGDNNPMKNSAIQKAMGWKHPEQSRRVLAVLQEQGLATVTKDYWTATPKGQKYLNTLEAADQVQEHEPLKPANLGPAPYPMPAHTRPPMPPTQ